MSRHLGNGSLVRARNRAGDVVYVGRWTDSSGRYHRKQFGTDARAAQRVFADVIRKRDLASAGLGREEGQERLLEDLCARYIADLGTRRGERHTSTTRKMLAALRKSLGPVRVRQVSVEWALQRRAARQAEGCSNRTCNAELAALRTCFTWGVRAGLIGTNPLESLRPLPATPDTWVKRRFALSDEQIASLRHAAQEQDLVLAEAMRTRMRRIPQAPLWDTLLGAGIRWGEAASLRWADVDLERGSVRVRAENSKNHRTRTVPIATDLRDTLAALHARQCEALGARPNPWAPVFLTPRGRVLTHGGAVNAMKIFRRLLLRADIQRERGDGSTFDIHALRHTYGTRMARLGVPPKALQELMGHRSMETTMTYYVHLEVEDLRAAIASVGALPTSAIPCTISATATDARGEAQSTGRRKPRKHA